MVTVTQEGGGD